MAKTSGSAFTGINGRTEASDWTCTITVTDSDGDAVDISAATAIEFYVLDGRAGTRLLSKALADGITKTGGASGEFVVSIDAADSIAQTGALWYEAFVTVGGERQPVAYNRLDHHDASSA